MKSKLTSPVLTAASAVLVLATPVAVWWMTNSVTHQPLKDPDYAVRPLEIDPAIKVGLTVAAVVLALFSLAILELARRHQRLSEEWWGVLGPLVAVGAICGGTYSMLTAPVIGANIGAGLASFVVPPAVIGLLVWAAWKWFTLQYRGR